MRNFRLLALAAGLCLFGATPVWAQTGTVTIVKNATPKDAQDFTFTVSGPSGVAGGAQLDDDAGAPGGNNNLSNAKTFALAPGIYTFKEDALPAGWNLLGLSCTPAVDVSVDMGNRTVKVKVTKESKITCTFSNRKEATGKGAITIRKSLVPANDPGRFTLQITPGGGGASIAGAVNVGNGGILGAVTVNAGNYIVGEIGGTAPPTSLSNYTTVITGAGCGPTGAVTVTPGASITCLITNTRKGDVAPGKVTVRKIIVPANDPGRFTLQLTPNGGNLLANYLNAGNTAVMGPVTAPPGNYTVSEAGGTNPSTNLGDYTAVYSGGCSPTGAIVVVSGSNITCTITNTRKTSACAYTLNADVNIYNPMMPFGPQTVHICRGGKVTFHNVNSGAPWSIQYISGPASFPPVPLATSPSSGVTAVLGGPGTYVYKINGVAGAPGFVLNGNIIVH